MFDISRREAPTFPQKENIAMKIVNTDALPAKAVYSVDEFGFAYGLGRTKTYALIKSGDLKVARVGGRTLIPVAAAEAWLAAHMAD